MEALAAGKPGGTSSEPSAAEGCTKPDTGTLEALPSAAAAGVLAADALLCMVEKPGGTSDSTNATATDDCGNA